MSRQRLAWTETQPSCGGMDGRGESDMASARPWTELNGIRRLLIRSRIRGGLLVETNDYVVEISVAASLRHPARVSQRESEAAREESPHRSDLLHSEVKLGRANRQPSRG